MTKLVTTKFQIFYKGLSPTEKGKYAKRIGITPNSIRSNFLRPIARMEVGHRKFNKPTRSQPNSERMLRFASASRGALDYDDMIDHFYRQ